MPPANPRFLVRVALPLLAALACDAAADPPTPGVQTRVPWTTPRVTGSPEPPLPYTSERAFAALKFDKCLDLVAAPGGDRLFVLEQSGKIFSFLNSQDVAAADLAIDIPRHCDGVRNAYAIAFHPDYPRRPFCYVCCIKAPNQPDGSQIIRFQVEDTDPPTIDGASQTTIITWPSGGHNGCCLKFGPDGMLYISTGDGVGPNPPDPQKSGQDITNLLSCILRIDVDHQSEGLNYRIPADNPFVKTPDARGEIWAYGFRNPWRMSFDRKTGDLWVGDVGWELWELLDRVERGGNYGWSVMEGRQPTNTEFPRGPTPILPPTIDHPHSESSSITDGLTYYGQRLEELKGFHIYSDYDTGKFWAFQWAAGKPVGHREIADTSHRVVGFGEDGAGEFYWLDHADGTIHRLTPNLHRAKDADFPRTLGETGLFESVARHAPASGVLPYSVAVEPWADHAVAERLVAVPHDGSIDGAKSTWSFPKDSVLVKTLSLDMVRGDPATRRRIETQLLHFDGREWQPYSYQWNDEQTDATLLPASGAERTFVIADPSAAGGRRRQKWRFSGRAECQRCHNKWSGPPLAFNLPLLNTTHSHGAGEPAPQLETLARLQLIKGLQPAAQWPALADAQDTSADLNSRARAYLQINCAHCHRLHAGGAVLSKMHYDVPLDQTNMLAARPSQGAFGILDAQVIAPGDPFRSVLLYRMSKVGGGRMPHIGSSEVDLEGVRLIHQWIAELPIAEQPLGNPAVARIRTSERNTLQRLTDAAPDAPEDLVERLLSSTSGALMLLLAIDDRSLAPGQAAAAIRQASRHEQAPVRDLFERFLPPEQRVKRLGAVVDPRKILALPGERQGGERVFFETAGAACKNCHRIGKRGADVGPDLTAIGKKLTPAQLLESILEPSKRIDPQYVTYLVETDEGEAVTGLLVKKDAQQVVLKTAQNRQVRLLPQKIERMAPQRQSLMPELLLQNLTAQQVADLLVYLHSLK